ncbi:MAG: hypothetical protein A2487_00015 [Candidatus Raymondbacteria bacterium RifOxyC12_full_50_8]|uniref:Uncharacterized protein n=1 Tax=Candidatus Raymondbacteria bacterium RIFOXYD12_FULL_49_13 TaxID=1817890 RepID=A0A1F7F7L7_UNCRA|nr:MAG: hypothetical protein A2248_21990 [Candidatus Raymondbacteria bacterium RIFOXYA2_FULL_49_16]OGJ88422.1 MAG: hypothetical protein A2350_11290 [Candidatus Raymondbacteria bacterium RifOxyB12_full_50_8]OGJ96289.1 MAG: hypothetical protein A2453_08860 [Candidatus Raymondbacteria bacterium RIFOXYC2_FULL_50_21]OGK02496.1 MAG: hypothetical protein A2519_12205 [Candidatus Raymondbacteria bacterium RIFOXYD12_FULL_49_13]OGK03132.1 MAG: hypothetical protein A2487_00015 [Candidatus Raymondbacteria b
MIIDFKRFQTEMSMAKTFQGLDPAKAEWWIGYQRGLRQAYHGPAFGTEAEHLQWYEAADSEDVTRAQRGQGYRKGFNVALGEVRYHDCQMDKSDCAVCSLTNYGRDCHNEPV